MAQVDSGFGSGESAATTWWEFYEEFNDAVDNHLTFVAAATKAECSHDEDQEYAAVASEYHEQVASIPPGTNLATETVAAVPGDNPTPGDAHATAHAEISYTHNGTTWEDDEPSSPPPPVRAQADEVLVGRSSAKAEVAFVKAGQVVKGISKGDSGERPGTPGSEGADSPSVSKAGAVELDPNVLVDPEVSEALDEAMNAGNDGVSRAVNDELQQSDYELFGDDTLGPTDVILPIQPPIRFGRDDTTLHVDLSGDTDEPTRSIMTEMGPSSSIMTEMGPSEPTSEPDPALEQWIGSDDHFDAVEVELPDASHVEISPPGESVPEPPDDLSQSLRDRLEDLKAAADDRSLSIHYAFERPFDDVVREYLSTPGTEYYEQFQALAPGETMAVELPVLRESRVDGAAATDAAALSRTEIGQGIGLVNDNVGSLPLAATTFGRKTIEFTPTPAGGADTPIAVHTGPDGRIVPGRTRRGEPAAGPVDFEVAMPRRDVHTVLRSEDPGAAATAVWDAGRVTVQPHGLMNQLSYYTATAALALGRVLGV